uniref:Protein-lysine N-methyltransferase n=1 Tax=Caenorhabditis tropicalis TaxID=1561998 RepID=A0A1I7TDY1_9PELO
MSDEKVEIASSQLGTKDFWDKRYEMELNNFEEHGDEGEIWFGASAENRIVKYLIDTKTEKDVSILDVGCGNGSVLRKLRSKGFSNLKGIDYCQKAVDLSNAVSESEKEENEELINIQFEQLDIISPRPDFFTSVFDVILDKGTWDAMSLSDERDRRLKAYLQFLDKSLIKGGRFIIFSCNFTFEEMREQFGNSSIEIVCEVPAAHSFSFGGKQGVTSTGAVFRKTS